VHAEIVEALEGYLDEECTLTLEALRDRVRHDFGVELSTTTISDKLEEKLIIIKQVA